MALFKIIGNIIARIANISKYTNINLRLANIDFVSFNVASPKTSECVKRLSA